MEWFTKRKIFVIIDMHQDVYGYGVGGNGAPDWASTQTKIQNLISDKQPWWMQNLEPKVKRSYIQFWKYKKKQFLQQHYIATWLKVIELFKDNPYVIGYDLMNEPHGGNIVKTLFGKFEKKWLMNFYNRLIPAIREVEKEKYLFFEPRSFGVNFGMKSHLKKIEDAIPNAKLIYAPHCYPRFVDIGKSYNKKSKKDLEIWFNRREKEAKMQNTPVLLGEFGVSPSKKDYDLFLNDLFRKADSVQMSWVYWSNDLGGWSPLKSDLTPSPILWSLLRVYPKATAGNLYSFKYEPLTKVFSMKYMSNTAILAPTEIALPKAIYPNGFNVSILGTTQYRIEIDSIKNTLNLYINENKREIDVTILPK